MSTSDDILSKDQVANVLSITSRRQLKRKPATTSCQA